MSADVSTCRFLELYLFPLASENNTLFENAAVLLVERRKPDFVFTDADFPREYANKTHPEDYVVSTNPLDPSMTDFPGRRAGHDG